MKITPSHILYYYRNKYEATRSIHAADNYIAELEQYIPNEIIDEYSYESAFRQVLSLVKETFRPDQFCSIITGENLYLLEEDFMDWLIEHKQELNRRLSWDQVCQLQCNYSGWKLANLLANIPKKTIKEMWNYTDEKQTEEFLEIINKHYCN